MPSWTKWQLSAYLPPMPSLWMCCCSPLILWKASWSLPGKFWFTLQSALLHLLTYRDWISFPRERAAASYLGISKPPLSELLCTSHHSSFTVIFCCMKNLSNFCLSVFGPEMQLVFNNLHWINSIVCIISGPQGQQSPLELLATT